MNMERYKTSARNHHGERGQEIIEFCVVLVLFVPLLIGSFVTGMSLIRCITAQQVCRDLDSMYMHGGDFSTYSMQQEAQRLAQGMDLELAASFSGSVASSDSASGKGLVTVTKLMWVGATTDTNCKAVLPATCTNHDSFVFEQRVKFGNISGLAATYPSSLGNPGSGAAYNSSGTGALLNSVTTAMPRSQPRAKQHDNLWDTTPTGRRRWWMDRKSTWWKPSSRIRTCWAALRVLECTPGISSSRLRSLRRWPANDASSGKEAFR